MSVLKKDSPQEGRENSTFKDADLNSTKFSTFSELALSPLNNISQSRNNSGATENLKGSSFSEWRGNDSISAKVKSSKALRESDNANLHSSTTENYTSTSERLPKGNICLNELSNTVDSNITTELQTKATSHLPTKDIKFLEHQLTQKKKLYKTVSLAKLPDNGKKLKDQIEELEVALTELKLNCKSEKSNATECEGVVILDSHQDTNLSVQSDKNNSENPMKKELMLDLNHSSLKQDSSSKSDINTGSNSSLPCEVDVTSPEDINCSRKPSQSSVPDSLTSDDSLNVIQNKECPNKDQRQMKLLNHVEPLPRHVIQEMNAGKHPSSYVYRDKTETKTVTEEGLLKLHSSLETCPPKSKEEDDPELLSSTLMPHQKQALTWLMWREKQQPRGGILADDMGLGKTITMISLILKHKEKYLQGKPATTKCELQGREILRSRGTLVICPASLLHQWNNEIELHCHKDALKVALYHGSGRERCIKRLAENDVVITTYNLISRESGSDPERNKARKSPNKSPANSDVDPIFLKIAWERIILDEAHNIKNHKSLTAQAVFRLYAKYRWALSGTPIHNDLMDLYSLIRFLQCSPFDDYHVWKKMINNKSAQSAERLNTLVKSLVLRRTKGQKVSPGTSLISLPPRHVHTYDLELSGKEKEVYEILFALSRSSLEAYLKQQMKSDSTSRRDHKNEDRKDWISGDSDSSKSVNSAPTSVTHRPVSKVSGSFLLVLLLRLQQCCNHLSLLQKVIQADNSFKLDEPEKDLSDVVSQMSNLLLEVQNQTDKQVTDQFSENGSQGNLNSLGLEIFYGDPSFLISSESTKVKAILKKLKKIIKMSTSSHSDKCIVVSQWVTMLEVVAHHLDEAGIRYHFIKGSMKPQERMAVVEDLNHNPDGAEVMLLSLKAGGVGLNLIGANHLFLIDVHWNPALQEQACDRIYRVGQTKDVFIHRFVIKNTVEEKIVQLQEQKLQLAKSVLGGTVHKRNRLTLEDLRLLFTI